MSVSVPTSEDLLGIVDTINGDHDSLALEVNELTDRVESLEDVVSPPWAVYTPKVYYPEDYFTEGDPDWTYAFKAMFLDIHNNLIVDAGGGVPKVDGEVHLSAHDYKVSGTILLDHWQRAQGLTIRGCGKRTSEIVTSSELPLLLNLDRWMNVTFYDVSFRSTNSLGSFLYSSSTGACQDWNFIRCEWRGQWNYGIGLDGPETSNTNSEWVFDRCHINGSYKVAWLWSGITSTHDQQDQFLNFSLRDCKVEYDHGDALRFDKGGSINVSGGSWIIKGQRPDGGKSRFFYMPDTGSHFDSVQNLVVTGVRFEPRNALAMIYEGWWKGQISFYSCMDDANGFKAFSADLVPYVFHNSSGVLFDGCQLVGKGHEYNAIATPSRQLAVYRMCARKNVRSAAFVIKTGPNASQVRVRHQDDRDGLV